MVFRRRDRRRAGSAAAGAREHLAVDGGDLVRQGFDARGVDGEVGIEQVRKPDAVGFGDQPQESTVGVEGPGASGADDFEGAGFVAVDEAVCDGAGGVLVGDLGGLVAIPFDVDDADRAGRGQAADAGAAA